MEEVKHEEAEYSGKNLRTIVEEIFHRLCKKDLAEQAEVDEDGVPEGDGPSLQGAVARRHRHHHRVDRHQDLGELLVAFEWLHNFSPWPSFSHSLLPASSWEDHVNIASFVNVHMAHVQCEVKT